MAAQAISYDKYSDTRYTYDQRRDRVWRVVTQWIQRDIPEGASVLDLGCGYCHFINHVRASVKHASDLNPQFARYANSDVQFHVSEGAGLPFLESETLEVVFASNFFEHLSRDGMEEMLREIYRVLRPSGRLLILQPNFRCCFRNYFDDYTHLQIFTDHSLRDLLSGRGFVTLRCYPAILPFSMKSRLPSWPFLVWLYLRSPWRPFAGQMYLCTAKAGS